VLGMAGRLDAVVPFVIGDWEGAVAQTYQTTSRTGFGDPVLRFAVFFIGAPALRGAEFARFRPKTIVGAMLRRGVPLGQYEATRLINLGSHRWTVSPQLGISHLAGRVFLEATAGVWLFTDNRAYWGTGTRSQDPLFTIQAHVGYDVRPGLWLAASSRQSLGGPASVDDGDKLAMEANNRIGLTVAVPIAGRFSLKVVGTTGVTATVGNDYRTIAAAWQVVF
jgi:Putative MetA-pathway of phenol degradation